MRSARQESSVYRPAAGQFFLLSKAVHSAFHFRYYSGTFFITGGLFCEIYDLTRKLCRDTLQVFTNNGIGRNGSLDCEHDGC